MTNDHPSKSNAPVTDLIDTLDEIVADGPVPARRLVDAFGRSALVPTLAVPALLVTSPLSAVPFFSSLCGVAMFLIAIQGALGRTRAWLPELLQNRTLPAERTHKAARAMRRFAGWLDWIARERLTLLVKPPFDRVLYLIRALAAACIPLLELVPMSSSIIGAGVSLIAVSLLTYDGLIALVGLAFFVLAGTVPWFIVSQVVTAVG